MVRFLSAKVWNMSGSRGAANETVTLKNAVFTALGAVTFRRAESDGTPAMVVSLGDRVAVVALASLQREFSIADDSPDGRMLKLIADSLDYVTALRAGDELPSEVLSGKASWDPAPKHQRRAAAKLRFRLLSWVDPTITEADGTDLEALETDPRLRAGVQRAFEQAAKELNLPDTQAVITLVAEAGQELAYIEALRETFLGRVETLAGQIGGLSVSNTNSERQTTLTQVRRLTRLALQQISNRFADVDRRTSEVLSMLRNAEEHRNLIRAARDWMYCSRRAWDPTFLDWAAAAPGIDESTWPRLQRTYQFLAPRFMPVQEWSDLLGNRPVGDKPRVENVMVW
jgi:hypothetical protein